MIAGFAAEPLDFNTFIVNGEFPEIEAMNQNADV